MKKKECVWFKEERPLECCNGYYYITKPRKDTRVFASLDSTMIEEILFKYIDMYPYVKYKLIKIGNYRYDLYVVCQDEYSITCGEVYELKAWSPLCRLVRKLDRIVKLFNE